MNDLSGVKDQPWYDTREGIEKVLEEGLSGLLRLAKMRGKAVNDKGGRLNQWCIYGLFWMDCFGQCSKITQGAPRDRIREIEVPDVMTKEELAQISPMSTFTMACCLPPLSKQCDRCLKGWSMDNVGDYYPPRDPEAPPRHTTCQALYIIEEEQKLFQEVLDKSEIPYTSMRIIPNEYYNDPTFFGPWFIVETEQGPLRIGYRKRVINIDWLHTNINHNGDVLFKDEKVTTWDTGVHAWGKNKAVEYLRRLFA